MSCHVGAGNQTHVSWKSSQCSWVLSLLPGPQDTWFITIIWYLAYIHCTLATDHSDPSRVPTPLFFVLSGGASDSGCQSCMADSCTHRGSSLYLLPLASNLFPPTYARKCIPLSLHSFQRKTGNILLATGYLIINAKVLLAFIYLCLNSNMILTWFNCTRSCTITSLCPFFYVTNSYLHFIPGSWFKAHLDMSDSVVDL